MNSTSPNRAKAEEIVKEGLKKFGEQLDKAVAEGSKIVVADPESFIIIEVEKLLDQRDLEAEAKEEEAYKRGQDDQLDAERRVEGAVSAKASEAPMGVSQWRAHGEKYGYWQYFEEQIAAAREGKGGGV